MVLLKQEQKSWSLDRSLCPKSHRPSPELSPRTGQSETTTTSPLGSNFCTHCILGLSDPSSDSFLRGPGTAIVRPSLMDAIEVS
jgi:hypothetical protein